MTIFLKDTATVELSLNKYAYQEHTIKVFKRKKYMKAMVTNIR